MVTNRSLRCKVGVRFATIYLRESDIYRRQLAFIFAYRFEHSSWGLVARGLFHTLKTNDDAPSILSVAGEETPCCALGRWPGRSLLSMS